MEIQVGKYKHPAPASKFKHTVHCTAVTAHSCIISDMQNLQGQTQMQAQASDVLGNTCKVPVWMVTFVIAFPFTNVGISVRVVVPMYLHVCGTYVNKPSMLVPSMITT